MQLQDLRRQGTDLAIEERLKQLPNTLKGTYDETLDKIENMDTIADRQYARNALSLLLCARHQLQSDEFLSLISVIENGPSYPISKGQLLQICSHFIMFDSTTNTFRFSHLTVREFLEHQELFNSASINALAAETCLSKLIEAAPPISIEKPLLKYPFLFWAEHSSIASQQRCLRLEEMLGQFLQSEETGSCFYRWHRTTEEILELRQLVDLDLDLDCDARIRLEAALCNIPRVLFAACAYDFCGVLSPEQWRMAQKQYTNKAGETPQEVALRHGSGGILEWQSRSDSSFEVTEEFIEIAAGNRVHGETVIALLLSYRAETIEITEEMVRAAAWNYRSGEGIMALLLESDMIHCVITEEIVYVVVEYFSPSIFQRLCDRAADEISIEDWTFRAAVANLQHRNEITAMLLDMHRGKVEIMEETVTDILDFPHGKEILALFFDHPKVRISITEDVLKAAARSREIDEDMWTFLLNKRGTEVPITKDIVVLAARNYKKGNMLITRLLDECATVLPTTSTVVKEIVGNANRPTVEKFLNMTGVDILITKGLIEAISIHPINRGVLELLLEKGTTRHETMHEVVNAIVRQSAPATLHQFLTRSGIALHIEEEVVEAAVENWNHGDEMINFFLGRKGGEVPVTEQAIKTAFMNSKSGQQIIARLVEKSANTIPMTEWVICKIARHASGSVFRQLLDQRASDIQITAEVIEAVADGGENSEEEWRILFENGMLTADAVGGLIGSIIANSKKSILQLFIDQIGVEIHVTEEIVHAAMRNLWYGNGMMVGILENSDRRTPITKKAINSITMGFDTTVLQECLNRGYIDTLTSQELILAAAGNLQHGKELIHFLLEEYIKDIPIVQEVVEAAADNMGSGHDILALLLEKRGGMIPVTEKALCSIIRQQWKSAKTLMLILEKIKTEVLITEKVLQEAVMIPSIIPRPRTEILRLLLDRQGRAMKITERIVNTAACNGCYAKDMMALLLDKGGPGIPITANTIEAIFENDYGWEVLTLFLQRGITSIPITEKSLEKARNNKRKGYKLRKLLPHFANNNQNDTSLLQKKEKSQYYSNKKQYHWGYIVCLLFFIVLIFYLNFL